jgi:hypothetical protein
MNPANLFFKGQYPHKNYQFYHEFAYSGIEILILDVDE